MTKRQQTAQGRTRRAQNAVHDESITWHAATALRRPSAAGWRLQQRRAIARHHPDRPAGRAIPVASFATRQSASGASTRQLGASTLRDLAQGATRQVQLVRLSRSRVVVWTCCNDSTTSSVKSTLRQRQKMQIASRISILISIIRVFSIDGWV